MNSALLRLGCWLVAVTVTAFATACGGDGDAGKGNSGETGETSSSGSPSGTTTGGCVNEGCNGGAGGTAQATSSSGAGGACAEVTEGDYSMFPVGAGSSCQGFGPGACGVVQDGCKVAIDCEGFPQLTVTLDKSGSSDEVSVPIGDGVVAKCHFDWEVSYTMDLTCSAQGVTCKWSGNQN